MYELLRKEVVRSGDRLNRFTQELIRIPSPTLHEKEVAARVDAEMRALRYDLVFTDDVGNVVGVIVGDRSGGAVVLTTHMDTGKPDGIEDWRSPPFSGEIAMGRIHGVGAAACKGSLASLIYAGHGLSAVRPVGNAATVIVVATVAGAGGAGIGVRHLLRTTIPEIRFSPMFALVGEPTALTVMRGGGGRVALELRVTGPDEKTVRREGHRVHDAVCSDGTGDRRTRGSWSPARVGGLDLVRLESGWVCTVYLDRRLAPEESTELAIRRVERDLDRMVATSRKVKVEVEVVTRKHHFYTGHTQVAELVARPWSTDPADPMVLRARDAMVTAGCGWAEGGRGSRGVHVSSSGSVAAGELGLPVLGYGPGEHRQAEACNESVSLLALESATYGSAVLAHGLRTSTCCVEHRLRPTEGREQPGPMIC